MKNRKLNKKQELFVLEYLKELDVTHAYQRVYKCKSKQTAQSNGSRLLTNANVQTYIKKLFTDIRNNKIADIEEVMEYLTNVLRGKSESEIVVIEGTGEGCSCARKINKKPDEKERIKAAELIGKRYGIFTENFKAGGVVSVQIVNDLEDDPDENSS